MKKPLIIYVVTCLLLLASTASANNIASSTMHFEGDLTDNGDGTYSGVVAMIDEGGGDSGYDIYGEEGATAWFGNDPGTGPVWTSQAIGSYHDAWPTWTPDTPDWYQYSLDLYVDGGQQKWAVRNHPGGTQENPWYDVAHWGSEKPAMGVPMSGSMLWYSDGTGGYAEETDTGAYLPATGTPEIPGGTAGYGGGVHAWDMDWSWGSEVVPLELSGFQVAVTLIGGSTYAVTLIPAEIPTPTEVWVDDDYCDGCANDGYIWGYNAFDNIQGAVDAIGGISPTMQSGGDRLADLQNNDGGWDWPLDDGDPDSASPTNTVGPIAMGLAQTYLHTKDPDHLASLQQAGAFLLTKTNKFSPSDGYLAAMLDLVLGVTTYTSHVITYFYDELAAGTYDRNGEGTLYSTASYVQLIRDSRSGTIANLAAWDIGMGLVGAASAGASTAEWIAGVKAEIDELDGAAWYDVLGLAGAAYGLAFVGEDFDPTAGEHAAAGSLSDLVAILAGYQIDGGGFSWSSLYLNPGEGNETIQETAYAILALNEFDRDSYLIAIQGAANYIKSVQLITGGWENYSGSGENNEITGEALWGYTIVYPPVGTSTVYVAAGTYDGTVDIDGISKITISGDDKTTVIVQPASTLDQNGCGHTSDRQAVFRVVNSTDVVLQNMTMDFNLVKANGVTGIFYCDSTGTLHNNIIKNMWVDDLSGGYYEIGSDFTAPGYTDSDRASITISDNTFIDMGRLGTVTHWYVNANITGNTFYNIEDDFGYAIEIGGPSTATISGNTIYGFDTPAATDDSESAGIYIENSFTGSCPWCTSLSGITKNVLVENNEIYDSQYGMWIGNGYDTFAGDVDINVTLNGNNFHNNIDGGAWIQDEDKEDGSSVHVSGAGNSWTDNGSYGLRIYTTGDGDITVDLIWETISGNATGISVEDTAGGSSNSSYSVSITQSSIIDNSSHGINNTVTTFIVDAEYNWWGDASGPHDPDGTNEADGITCYDPSTMKNADGTGNGASDLYVDYCPWHTYQNPDVDGDGICNPYTTDPSCEGSDNCPFTPNEFQEDTYPPGGNGIGDACECEADFNCDGNVDADDVMRFLWDFGRSEYNDPCTNDRWCYGDFSCDGAVDAADVTIFLEDFGRSPFFNPCPACTHNPQNWCSY